MKRKATVSRRTFLKAANAIVAAPYVIPSGVLAVPGRIGVGERIRIGHIGWGGRSRGLYRELDGLRAKGETESIAVCDVDENRLAGALKDMPGATPYRDYRRLLERKDIDAVVIGTPDHWHGVQTVHAAECGKHIYVEKPACCTIEEGQAMIAAAQQGRRRRASRLPGPFAAGGLSDAPLPGERRDRKGAPRGVLPLSESRRQEPRAGQRAARVSRLGLVAGPASLAPLQRALPAGHFPLADGIRRRADSRSRSARHELCHVVDGTGRCGACHDRGYRHASHPRAVGRRRADASEVHVQEPGLDDDVDPNAQRAIASGRGADEGRTKGILQDQPARLWGDLPRRAGNVHALGRRRRYLGGAQSTQLDPARRRRTCTAAPGTWKTGSRECERARRRL